MALLVEAIRGESSVPAAGAIRMAMELPQPEVTKILKSDEVKDRFGKTGVEVVDGTPAQISGFLKREVARWAKVVQDAGIKAD